MAKRWRFQVAIAVAILVFALAYANSLDNAFNFDDSHVVEQNLFIRDLANVPRFFTDARTFSALPQNATYRPILSVTLALDYWLANGLTPRQYHITQLALFALLGALLAVFYRRLYRSASDEPAGWVALFAATLYCVHTGNTQVGNYISSRSEILSALGVVGAFLIYDALPRWRRFHLYLIPVVLGALAKNPAVVFAPLLLAWKLLIEEQLSAAEVFSRAAWPRVRSAIVSTVPAFVLSAVLFVWIESMNPPGQNYGGVGRAHYLATQAWVWVRYARMYFWPSGLSVDTDLAPFASIADPRAFAGILLLAASIYGAVRASRSRELRPVAFGILWFWLGIAPTSSIFPLAEVTNDHRPFLGFIGLNAAMAWLAWVLIRRAASRRPALRGAIPVMALGILAAHSAATWQRNKVWRDDESLWADVMKKSPRNGRGIMNYGLTQMRRGRLTEARDLFVRAQQMLPNYSFLEVNLGVVNNALREPAIADRHFMRSIALDGGQPVARRLYARFLLQQGRGPEAIPHLQRALELSPGETESRHLLMAIHAVRGADAELRALVDETLRFNPSDPDALAYARGVAPLQPATDDYRGWFDLGFALTRSERHLESAQAYRVAIARDAAQADAWNNLGWTLGKLGFFDEAEPALTRAVALRSEFPLARNNLAWVRGERAKR